MFGSKPKTDEQKKTWDCVSLIKWIESKQCTLPDVERFVEAGGDINAQNDIKRTALTYAAENNDGDLCEVLLANGANPHIQSSVEFTARDYARDTHVRRLLEGAMGMAPPAPPLPPTPEELNEKLFELLMQNSTDNDTMLKLIADGVDLEKQSNEHENQSLLMYAAKNDNLVICKALVNAGANIEARSYRGYRADQYANTSSKTYKYLCNKLAALPPEWIIFDGNSVAEVSKNENLRIKITNVFNLSSRCKTTMTQLLESNSNHATSLCHTQPQSFDDLSQDELKIVCAKAAELELPFDEAKVIRGASGVSKIQRLDKVAKPSKGMQN